MQGIIVSKAIQGLHDVIHRYFYPRDEEGRPINHILLLPDEILNLSKELESLQAILGDDEERQEHDDEVKRWMSRLKDPAYEAQDITEKHLNLIERRRRQQQQQRGCCCNPLKSLRTLRDGMVLRSEASKICALTDKISRLASKMEGYGIEFRSPIASSSRMADPVRIRAVDEEETLTPMIGLDEDIKEVENQLIYGGNINVIGICGTNGIGKTTLVREVLRRSTLVEEHFQAKAWAFLGKQLQVCGVLKKILSDLLSSFDDDNHRERMEQQEQAAAGSGNHERFLCETISRILRENKCLVVLDDFWTRDTWNTNDALRSALSSILSPDSSSKLVLTTCDASVLSSVDCRGYLHQPRCLATAQIWQLFQHKTASLGEGILDNLVKDMGRRIVEGPIDGLPLTIHVLGGIFANETYFLQLKVLRKLSALFAWEFAWVSAWVYLSATSFVFLPIKSRPLTYERAKSIRLLFGKHIDEVGIQQVLKLSYKALPRRLRSCLLEMSLHYEQGQEMQAEELIELWSGKKIVKDRRRGKRCLDELVNRSLIQVAVKKISDVKIETYQLHCLVQDFYRDLESKRQSPLCSPLTNAFKMLAAGTKQKLLLLLPIYESFGIH